MELDDDLNNIDKRLTLLEETIASIFKGLPSRISILEEAEKDFEELRWTLRWANGRTET